MTISRIDRILTGAAESKLKFSPSFYNINEILGVNERMRKNLKPVFYTFYRLGCFS